MKRFGLAAIALIAPLGALAPLAVAAPAQAAVKVPFTITEQIDFTTGTTTFTATGPLCQSGTFADDVKVFAPSPGSPGFGMSGGFNLLIHTVYTCADGSSTFNAVKHNFITFNDNGFTGTGPIQLRGGTGAFTDLVANGVDNGSVSGNTGVGQISGFVVQS